MTTLNNHKKWMPAHMYRRELHELALRLSNSNGAEFEGTASFMIARKKLQPVLRCLSCDHPLPLPPADRNNQWQGLALPTSTTTTTTTRHHRSIDDIVISSKSDMNYQLDPLLLQDGQLLSRYPRMMPPPTRVRTAAGGGGMGLSIRSHIRAKLEYKIMEERMEH